MSEPFIGEIRIFGCDYAPEGWALCNGQKLQIMENQALYSIIGTTYGGDGRTTFCLPDLRGRVPIHRESAYPLGRQGGEEKHVLTENEMASHAHQWFVCSDSPDQTGPDGKNIGAYPVYTSFDGRNLEEFSSQALSHAGGNRAHDNMQPSCALNFCIALQGIYPSRS